MTWWNTDDKLRTEHFILLEQNGDEGELQDKWYYSAKNITNMTVTVYNMHTRMVSTKHAYKDKNGKLYINNGKCIGGLIS